MAIPCPYCRSTIATDDINVATDLALCRACGRTSNFSDLVRRGANDTPSLTSPPEGAWFERTRNGFRTGATTRSCTALFLIPFTCVWAGGSLGGIYGSQIVKGAFNPFSSLFGIPFLIGSCVLIAMCVMTCAGKVELIVDGDRLRIFTGVAQLGWTRRYHWPDFVSVREDSRMSGRGFSQHQQVVLLEGQRRAAFGTGWNENRRYFVVNALRAMLADSGSGSGRQLRGE